MDILKRIDHAQQFCKFYADGAYSVEKEKWNYHVTPEFIKDIRQYIESLQLKLMHLQKQQAEPCIGKDPRCPCQDGDACHYKDCVGTKARPVAQPEQELVAPKCGAIIEVFDKDWRLQYLSLPVGKHKLYTQQYTYTTPPAAPVAWKWHQAPVKTSWGHDMVVADLAIDKDNTVSVYCERDQTNKVEAMFNPPAQPEPVQEPVEVNQATMELAESVGLIGPASRTHDLHSAIQRFHDLICVNATIKAAQMAADAIREATPPAAQRPWQGLEAEEILDLFDISNVYGSKWVEFARTVEAKLRSKNGH